MTLDKTIQHHIEEARELKSSLSDFPKECFTQCEIEEIVTQAQEHDQLAIWLTKLDEARKIIWDTSLEDACKIMKLRNLIDYDLGKRAMYGKTD